MLTAGVFAVAAFACGCTSDAECSLLGACRAGVCECRPPWGGEHCEQLLLKPTRDAAGLNLLPSANTSTWGGDVLQLPNGTWCMVYSEFLYGCGVNSWLQNSVVRLAVSTTRSASGPYAPHSDIFGVFSHEPTLAHDARRNVTVMFFTHSATPPTFCGTCHCATGNSTSDCPPDWDANGRNGSAPLLTYLSYSRDLVSWSRPRALLPQLDPYSDTAFQGVILPNGSLVAMTRTQALVAADWNDTETYREVARFKANAYGEGAHLWWDDNAAVLHLLSHDGDLMGTTCGKHWWSRDAVHWATHGCAYQAKGVATAGGGTVDFGRRERPHPVFDATGALVALSTAVTAMPTECVGRPRCLYRWPDASYTLVQDTTNS